MLGAFVSRPVHGSRSNGTARPATRPRPADAILRLQRAAGNAAVGRVLQRACASRAPGEIERSRTGKGILIDDVRLGPNALLVSDFGVGRADVKAETKRDPDLQSGIADFERDPSSYKLSILGLDDCHGLEPVREKLRKERAESVRDLLGPKARQRVAVADGAPLEDYAADNLSAAGRAKNRGALVTFNPKIAMPPVTIAVPKPTYRRVTTINCSDAQAEELAAANTIAVAMVEKAIKSITGGASAEVNAIMRKFFNDDSRHTRAAIYRGFHRILTGLRNGPYYMCMACSKSGMAGPVGPIVICNGSFQGPNRSGATTFPPKDYELPRLILHEASHRFDLNFGTQYCDWLGCGSALSPGDAVNNPDSYAFFAEQVFTGT